MQTAPQKDDYLAGELVGSLGPLGEAPSSPTANPPQPPEPRVTPRQTATPKAASSPSESPAAAARIPSPAIVAAKGGQAASKQLPSLPSPTKPKAGKKASDGQLQRNSASFNPLL